MQIGQNRLGFGTIVVHSVSEKNESAKIKATERLQQFAKKTVVDGHDKFVTLHRRENPEKISMSFIACGTPEEENAIRKEVEKVCQQSQRKSGKLPYIELVQTNNYLRAKAVLSDISLPPFAFSYDPDVKEPKYFYPKYGTRN